jgi:FkbM family methyltransferase
MRDVGHYVSRRPRNLVSPFLTLLFNALHDRHAGRVFVLQVGAGNGEGQPQLLSRFRADGWSGLLIEPHPGHFAALEALHADSDRVAILNLGLSDVPANPPLHSLSPELLARNPRLARGRASLIRDRLATPGVAPDDILSVEVPVLTFASVLEELGIDSAQLVVINTGGHEAQVLRSFDLAPLSAALVLVHSTPGTAADAEIIDRLAKAGLAVFRLGGWLTGLQPAALAVPMEELLTCFNMGSSAPDSEE